MSSATVSKKPPLKKKTARKTRICIGIDASMSAIALAARGTDRNRGDVGPVWTHVRFGKGIDYFTRLHTASKTHDAILDLMGSLKTECELADTYIAIEEPWPMGMLSRRTGNFQASFAKQQAQMTGAVISGLVRYGYVNVFEINSAQWRAIVARDLGLTIHPSKWGKGLEGKMRPKEWAHMTWPQLEELPDLIQRKEGLVPRPENSRARAAQPDDRYDALGIMEWMVENYSS